MYWVSWGENEIVRMRFSYFRWAFNINFEPGACVMCKIPPGGIYVHSPLHSGMATPAINFLWLETELDLDAFIPREETFSAISPVVIVWSWEWAHWDSPWITGVLPVIYAPAQASKRPHKLSRAKEGMICCQWHFGDCSEEAFSSSSCCRKLLSSGVNKTEIPSKFPFVWECTNAWKSQHLFNKE